MSKRAVHEPAAGVREWRVVPDVEVEVREEDGGPMIVGHGAVFDVETTIGGVYREVVRRGAFMKTIADGDVRGLFNHDGNIILGRNRAGTMALVEDQVGLEYRIKAPTTDLVRDMVLEPIRRRDVSGSSFGFSVVKRTWDAEQELRELLEVKLYDVGPVTFPAYPSTDAAVRSYLAECSRVDEIELIAALRGTGLSDAEVRSMVTRMIEVLDTKPEAQRAEGLVTADAVRARIRALEIESGIAAA